MRSRLTHLLLATAFAGALAVSTSTGTAYACDCAIAAPDDYLAMADVAFEGVVATVAIAPSMPGRDPSLDPISVTFAVETVLKGPADDGIGSEIVVATAGNSAACGMAFSPGERWRIYATLTDGAPQTGSCSGDELLGHGAVPEPSPASPPVALLAAVGVTLVLAAFSAWAFTRRPRGSA